MGIVIIDVAIPVFFPFENTIRRKKTIANFQICLSRGRSLFACWAVLGDSRKWRLEVSIVPAQKRRLGRQHHAQWRFTYQQLAGCMEVVP